jgi:hypothetical protein
MIKCSAKHVSNLLVGNHPPPLSEDTLRRDMPIFMIELNKLHLK